MNQRAAHIRYLAIESEVAEFSQNVHKNIADRSPRPGSPMDTMLMENAMTDLTCIPHSHDPH